MEKLIKKMLHDGYIKRTMEKYNSDIGHGL